MSGRPGVAAPCVSAGPTEHESGAGRASTPAMGIRSSERVRRASRKASRSCAALLAASRSRTGAVLPVSRRQIEPAAAAAAVSDLDREQSDAASRGKGGAPARRPPAVERGLRRVARLADGWMTNKLSPDEFRSSGRRSPRWRAREGRDPEAVGSALYHKHQHQRGPRGGPRGEQDVSSTPTTRRSSLRLSSRAGRWRARPHSCIAELRAYAAAARAHGAPLDVVGSSRGSSALPRRGRAGLR
jgi:alkanesulfonate monooxygenase SsuD/methylene tetrahydromethanopterin reductase-like flavin-dependent oxidoreductase (luciferase family)